MEEGRKTSTRPGDSLGGNHTPLKMIQKFCVVLPNIYYISLGMNFSDIFIRNEVSCEFLQRKPKSLNAFFIVIRSLEVYR